MDNKINVSKPDGTVVSVPQEQLPLALSKGYQVETPEQANERHQVNQYVKDNDNLKGSLKVLGGQFGDEFLGGIPEAYLDKTQSPLETKKREAIKEAHNIANSLGGVGGFAASMALPLGPLGRAAKIGSEASKAIEGGLAAESLIGRLASRSAGEAVSGAIATAPQAAAHYIEGDPQAAGETMLAGAFLSALHAPISLGIEHVAPYAKGLAEKAQTLAQEHPEAIKDMVDKGIDLGTGKVMHKALGFAGLSHGPLGYLGGEALGEAISPAIKKVLEDYGVAKKLSGVVTEQLDNLPKYVDALTNGGYKAASKAMLTGAAVSGVKLKTADDWKAHIQQINNMANAEPIDSNSPYEIAFQDQQKKAAQYLKSQLPEVDVMPLPFEKPKEMPSKDETKEYLNKVQMVQDPFYALKKMQQGRLTSDDIKTLQSVYPFLYQKMKDQILLIGSEQAEKSKKVRHGKRDQLSTFLQQPLGRGWQPQNLELMKKINQPQQPKRSQAQVKMPELQTGIDRAEQV